MCCRKYKMMPTHSMCTLHQCGNLHDDEAQNVVIRAYLMVTMLSRKHKQRAVGVTGRNVPRNSDWKPLSWEFLTDKIKLQMVWKRGREIRLIRKKNLCTFKNVLNNEWERAKR